jgi:NTE family protein
MAVIKSRLPSTDWPQRDLRIAVVDASSGAFRVITAADGVPLLDAVTASSAVPGVYPPVPIENRLYIDGGIRSTANADLARGCSKVVVLAPTTLSVGMIKGPQQQLDTLGVPSIVISPDQAARAAMGENVLDPGARRAAAQAGLAQAQAVLEQVRAAWA